MGDGVVVIGVGNPDRGDDGVGHRVVSLLQAAGPPGITLLTTMGADPATLIDAWRSRDVAVVVDAMVSGAPPGTVRRFDLAAGPLPESVRLVSTHALGATAAIEMARALDRLPARMEVYGIEAHSFGFGDPIAPELEAAAQEVAATIGRELAG